MTDFVNTWHRNERESLLKALIPSVFWRGIQYLSYRRRYPEAFVSGAAAVGHMTRVGTGCAIKRNVHLDSSVTVGRYTFIGPGTLVGGEEPVEIGQFCSIASDVYIFSTTHNHRLRASYPLTKIRDGLPWNDCPENVSRPILIGNDVWIGHGAKILAGAEIGDGCVVAAGAVVPAKSYPPYSVIAGVPGKVIDKRFDEKEIEALLNSAWWDLPAEEIFSDEMILHLTRKPGA